MAPPAVPTVALLPWGNVLEDVLDPLGVSLEAFCREFRGSWMFGYVEALRLAGVRTVLICLSRRVGQPARFTHQPSGATVWVLPSPQAYQALARKMLYPYGQTVTEAFGEIAGARRLLLPLYALARETGLYLATPLRSLAQVVRREGCRAILCQEYEYPRFDVCVLLGRAMHIPVFATFQGGTYQHSHLERWLRPLALRACAGLVIAPQSESERVCMRYPIPSTKVARVYNPVDVNVWRPMDRDEARAALGLPAEARVVVWHGRMSIHTKGLDTLLEAWRRLCHHPAQYDRRLLLIGTGDGQPEMQQRLAGADLAGVHWLDQFVHDPAVLRRYLSAGDVYAFASRYEGFPVAPLEAMACGLPVVTTDTDGMVDILQGGETGGGLVVPRDNAEALARALASVLDSPAWAGELGRRARRRVEDSFSPAVVGEQLRDFLGCHR